VNYIGSKNKLASFIKTTVATTVKGNLESKVFCDLFAGTGIVGRTFKPYVKQVIANDIEYYSYVLNQNYIGNNQLKSTKKCIDFLNNLEGKNGFVFNNYSENGTAGRLYFNEENGKKIDAIRYQIELWYKNKTISTNLYYYLLAALIESADKVANTASVYGAFLKSLKKSAQKSLLLTELPMQSTTQKNKVYNEDSNELIKKISGDILYLDPPYNARQYGSNYHILNTIASYDTFNPSGKTGLRAYYKSAYCKKNAVKSALEELIKNANFNYIFLSYNNEGLMTEADVAQIFKKYGKYSIEKTEYQRFKADKTERRNHKATYTIEYLHILEK
jgi:adenine-specific DNA-methyltransferase